MVSHFYIRALVTFKVYHSKLQRRAYGFDNNLDARNHKQKKLYIFCKQKKKSRVRLKYEIKMLMKQKYVHIKKTEMAIFNNQFFNQALHVHAHMRFERNKMI